MTAIEPYEDETPVSVDPPAGPRVIDVEALAARTRDRVPLVPEHFRDRATFRLWLGYQAGRVGYNTVWHTAHAPVYVARLALWSPVGLWRATRWVAGWVFDAEAARPDRTRCAGRPPPSTCP